MFVCYVKKNNTQQHIGFICGPSPFLHSKYQPLERKQYQQLDVLNKYWSLWKCSTSNQKKNMIYVSHLFLAILCSKRGFFLPSPPTESTQWSNNSQFLFFIFTILLCNWCIITTCSGTCMSCDPCIPIGSVTSYTTMSGALKQKKGQFPFLLILFLIQYLAI